MQIADHTDYNHTSTLHAVTDYASLKYSCHNTADYIDYKHTSHLHVLTEYELKG